MIKKVTLLTVLVSSLLACTKEETVDSVPEPAATNSVTLSLIQQSFTKGVTNQKGDAEYASVSSGKIYFLDSLNVSVLQRQLTSDEVATFNNPTSSGTVTISGVPSSAKRLFFVANIKTDAGQVYPAVEGTDSTNARLRMDRLQGDAVNVPMSGQSANFVNSSGFNYTASVAIEPIVARLEIGKITCQNNSGTSSAVSSDITSYKLAGVYINNVNPYVLLRATPYLNNPVNITGQSGWTGSGWDTYFTSNPNFPYFSGGAVDVPAGWAANTYVNYCAPVDSGLVFYPDATYGATIAAPSSGTPLSWAYQICPSSALPDGQITPVADIPHIVLKLTNVKYVNNEDGKSTLYVVVSKYKEDNTTVKQFKRGHVYRISNLTFSQNMATNKPYDTNIQVTANVTVKPWVITMINPEW